MNVQLDTKTSAIEWSAGELVKLRKRIELSIERCWEINGEDEIFLKEWGHRRDDCTPTVELMTDFFETAHIHSVESGDLGAVYDVEAAYLAWLAFKNLADRINQDRAN